MDGHGVGLEKWQVFLQSFLFGEAQLVQPGAAAFAGRLVDRARQLTQHRRRVSSDADVNAAVVAQLRVIKIDLDDLGVRRKPLTVAETEVERRADDQDR